MADIIQFKKGEEQEPEECQCETCEAVEEFLQYILQTDDQDELKEILADLFREGKINGYQQALYDDIESKKNALMELNGICECGECETDKK